ncbi:MAG: hypothetical protein A2Y21_09275 [Clostridiales bacterium GWC2_40_7]|nr:MAG: hypothetical protein A2Y21_09275 [Clostridiales bacterium GWC2_40_7]
MKKSTNSIKSQWFFGCKKRAFRFIMLSAVLVFTIAVNIVIPLKAYSANSSSNSKAELEMEVNAGFDGVAKLGAYTP